MVRRSSKRGMSNSRPKAVAITLGAALFFILPITISFLLGDNTPLYLPLLVAPYALSGAVLGYLWPHMSWRLGLWLLAVWPPMLLFAVFLSADVPWSVKGALKDLHDLLGYSMILIAACLGAEVGAIIKRHRPAKSSLKV